MVDFTQAAQTIGVSTGQQSGTVIESLNPEELVADGAIHHSIDLSAIWCIDFGFFLGLTEKRVVCSSFLGHVWFVMARKSVMVGDVHDQPSRFHHFPHVGGT